MNACFRTVRVSLCCPRVACITLDINLCGCEMLEISSARNRTASNRISWNCRMVFTKTFQIMHNTIIQPLTHSQFIIDPTSVLRCCWEKKPFSIQGYGYHFGSVHFLISHLAWPIPSILETFFSPNSSDASSGSVFRGPLGHLFFAHYNTSKEIWTSIISATNCKKLHFPTRQQLTQINVSLHTGS